MSSPALVQCPQCHTAFRVGAAQLQSARGQVRCGACLCVFSAPANLITVRERDAATSQQGTEAATPATTAPRTDIDDTVAPYWAEADGRPDDIPLGDLELGSEDDDYEADEAYEDEEYEDEEYEDDNEDAAYDDEETLYEDERHEELDDDEYEYALAALPPPRQRHTLGLSLMSLLLLCTLGLQLQSSGLYAKYSPLTLPAPLADQSPWLCGFLPCPPVGAADQALNLLRQEELQVATHPRYAGALQVNLSFRNEADAPQPFPALELVFNDANGKPHANRLFQPTEYLSPELAQLNEVPAHTRIQVQLDLIAPDLENGTQTVIFHSSSSP